MSGAKPQRNFCLSCLRISSILRELCCQFKYLTFNWHQNQTFKATYTWAVDNWRPNDCEAEDGSVISRMVSGAKPQQNFCLLCLRISSILGHFVVISNIWLLIYIKIKPSKLLILIVFLEGILPYNYFKIFIKSLITWLNICTYILMRFFTLV